MKLCPPGSHPVQSHQRQTAKGLILVQSHCRKNPSSKGKVLFGSNLKYLYEASPPKDIKLEKIKGFGGFHSYDPMIYFWVEYWKRAGLLPPAFDPLIVKSMIAVESSFRSNVITSLPNSSAAGLMQIVRSTLHPLSGKPNRQGYIEIKRHPIELEYDELLDPIVNVAAGVRWLAHKIMTSPKRRSESQDERIFAGIKYYHSWDRAGEKYAERVLKLYRDSRKPPTPKGDL